MKTKKPLRGAELAQAALTYIIEHPDKWDQRTWPIYGTCGCFIYHVCKIGEMDARGEIDAYQSYLMSTCTKKLQISILDFYLLYNPSNTLGDLKRLCNQIFDIKTKQNEKSNRKRH